MQDRGSAHPGDEPFVFVAVDCFDVGDEEEGAQGGLFRGLGLEEGGCGGGEEDADGEVGVVREGVQDFGEFDRGYGAGCCEEEVVFGVGEVVGSFEGWRVGEVVVFRDFWTWFWGFVLLVWFLSFETQLFEFDFVVPAKWKIEDPAEEADDDDQSRNGSQEVGQRFVGLWHIHLGYSCMAPVVGMVGGGYMRAVVFRITHPHVVSLAGVPHRETDRKPASTGGPCTTRLDDFTTLNFAFSVSSALHFET